MTKKLAFATMLLSVSAFAQNAASKAAAAVDTAVVLQPAFDSAGQSGWTTLSSVDIKPAGGKDLLITVSMQSGLFSFRYDSGSVPSPVSDALLQFSGLRVRVMIDGDAINLAAPGAVTWDRQLNFVAAPFSLPSLELNLKSGVRSFTFIKRNVGVGTHHIEVQGNFQAAAFETNALAGAAAFVTNRTLTVEEVSMK